MQYLTEKFTIYTNELFEYLSLIETLFSFQIHM